MRITRPRVGKEKYIKKLIIINYIYIHDFFFVFFCLFQLWRFPPIGRPTITLAISAAALSWKARLRWTLSRIALSKLQKFASSKQWKNKLFHPSYNSNRIFLSHNNMNWIVLPKLENGSEKESAWHRKRMEVQHVLGVQSCFNHTRGLDPGSCFIHVGVPEFP